MPERISIVVPCDLRYRNAVGALIQGICLGLPAAAQDPGLQHQVVSAFNEAFNNLAEHAAAGDAPVRIDVEISPAELAIELRDRGTPFDYGEVGTPDLDSLPESGLGIFIMRSFMHEVRYTPGSGGNENVLLLRRILGGPPPGESSTSTSPRG